MASKSTPTQYGTVAVTIHWLAAALIIWLLVSGKIMSNAVDEAFIRTILQFHAPAGILVLLLTFFRIFWWWKKDTKPSAIGNDPKWQKLLAKIIHYAFYFAIIIMGGSGIGLIRLAGGPSVIFGEGSLPAFHELQPHFMHHNVSKILFIMLILHAGAALFHQFIKKDGLIGRMWYK
jgi:cytochrome b561